MSDDPYKRLAERLDQLPNGFPPTEGGMELRLLQKLFTPEEADLAAQLRLIRETPEQIAARIGGDVEELRARLKSMAKQGLIEAGKAEGGLGFGLMPFVVGIYEMQSGTIDAELARLFEDYYQEVFHQTLATQPPFHRVVPVGETIRTDMEIAPYESVAGILDQSSAWGVTECICRKQKALIGEPCEHPLEMCMVFSKRPDAFEGSSTIRALTREEALATLRKAAEAGLVHTVSNNQEGVWYICNCCTCSCGILRGVAELGMVNVVARSSFVNQVDEEACQGCELCVDACQFDALTMEDAIAHVDETRCVGCGVCVLTCPEEALYLVHRPAEEIKAPPIMLNDWMVARAKARGQDITKIL
jgi:electron transport complex protein RnfB